MFKFKTIDKRRLFDASRRMVVYTEGVKLYQASKFREVAYQLNGTFTSLLSTVKYDTLDGMTKAELNKLVIALKNSQSSIYGKYVTDLLATLKIFMSSQKSNSLFSFESILNNDDEPSNDDVSELILDSEDEGYTPLFGYASLGLNSDCDDFLYSKISNYPMGANGLTIGAFISGFSSSAQAQLLNLTRYGWANGLTVAQAISAVSGPGGLLNKLLNQSTSVVETTFQQVSEFTYGAVSSAFADSYRWDSVLDNRTTEICIDRNGKKYKYGKGPFPPAHIRCRSHITPIYSFKSETEVNESEELSSWLSRQPKKFLRDAFTKGAVNSILSGAYGSEDFSKNVGIKPLTAKNYADKLKEIVTS